MLVRKCKAAARRLAAPSHGVVLTYHGVLAGAAPFPIWQYLPMEQIEEQFCWLAANCKCVKLSEFLTLAESGMLSTNPVAITFDDGFAINLLLALSLLERYQLSATFFIAAGFIGNGRSMWPEVPACILADTKFTEIEYEGRICCFLIPRLGIGSSYKLSDLDYAINGGLAASTGLTRWSAPFRGDTRGVRHA
jgi:peptidoglycan/xylan/chitin deacetylase (PgdA/CDA1 family)